MHFWFLCALLPLSFLLGCDDDESVDPGTAPVLSNLMLETDLMGTVGEDLTTRGSVTVADPDGDVRKLRATVNLPNGNSQDLPPSIVPASADTVTFSIQLLMVLRPPEAGTYRMDVRVDDAMGNLSEPVSFEVVAQ